MTIQGVFTNPARDDGFVRSPKTPLFVIPAKAGIQNLQNVLDSGIRRSDKFQGFLRFHQK